MVKPELHVVGVAEPSPGPRDVGLRWIRRSYFTGASRVSKLFRPRCRNRVRSFYIPYDRHTQGVPPRQVLALHGANGLPNWLSRFDGQQRKANSCLE
jgi:hypothetical protein